MKRQIAAVCAAALIQGACTDDPVSSPTRPEQNQITITDAAPPFRTQPRFDVSVEVAGSLLPKAPIELTATVTGLLETENATINIAMPEVQNARTSGWGAGYKVPSGFVAPIASRTSSLGSAQAVQVKASVQIHAPGYYRVVVTAAAEGDGNRTRAVKTQDFVSKEIWLLVGPTAGKVTQTFDAGLIADSLVKQPGPFHEKARRDRPTSPGGSTRSASAMESGSMTWHLQYYNSTTSSYEPASDVWVSGTYEALIGGTITPFSDITDANGNFTTPCEGWYYTSFDASASHTAVTIKPNTALAHYEDAVCNTIVNVVTLSNESHVLKNMMKAIRAADEQFWNVHYGVTVYLRTSYTWSWYFAAGDSIQLYSGHIWGDRGAEITAHEYGHSLHEKSLGGYPRSTNCDLNHGLPVYTDLQCALTEGFAEYFSVVARPDATGGFGGMTYTMEVDGYRDSNTNPDYPSDPYQPNGSVIEGAVASFLLDLTDNTPSEDAVSYPGSYVADVIKTCRVVSGGVNIQNNGIDHLIYCLEKSLDSSIFERFYKRGGVNPSSYSESATEPGTWSASSIRTLWLKSLYNQ